jgi:hypothetical protein
MHLSRIGKIIAICYTNANDHISNTADSRMIVAYSKLGFVTFIELLGEIVISKEHRFILGHAVT